MKFMFAAQPLAEKANEVHADVTGVVDVKSLREPHSVILVNDP